MKKSSMSSEQSACSNQNTSLFNPEAMLVFFNDELMCIAHYDTGEIVTQLEFVEENNTVIIKRNDTDYSEFFKSYFISTLTEFMLVMRVDLS
eukprot:5872782-Karenia_brevis.AAC.1